MHFKNYQSNTKFHILKLFIMNIPLKSDVSSAITNIHGQQYGMKFHKILTSPLTINWNSTHDVMRGTCLMWYGIIAQSIYMNKYNFQIWASVLRWKYHVISVAISNIPSLTISNKNIILIIFYIYTRKPNLTKIGMKEANMHMFKLC